MERKKNSQWLFLANRPACRAGRPFGETLVEEHLNSYNSPFKFLASDERPKKREECIREYDAETGNYYYCLRRLSERRSEWRGRHLRYYNPKWSIWLSVDPMAEKYPSFSSYAYTLQNPVRFVDPTGMIVEEGKAVPPDWYEDKNGNYEYFEGSGQRDGYENIGPSTNLIISQGDNDQSFSLNEDGSFTNMDSGRTYNKGESLTTNNGTEIKSNLTLGEKASDIVAPFVEVTQNVGTGIINQLDRGLTLMITGEDKADTNNYLIQNIYSLENWSFTKGRNTYSTGRPSWEEGKRMINNTISVTPVGITTGLGKNAAQKFVFDKGATALFKKAIKSFFD
jgi:RHS repeat-associated protein